MSVIVIIPSAGSGSRFGGSVPKQYLPLAGKPVLQRVCERFLAHPEVSRVIVPVADDRLAEMQRDDAYRSDRIEIVAGGATRQESVSRALHVASDSNAELVAVHDAVRPFFRMATFDALLAAARRTGAALPAVAVTDTIHVVEGQKIAATLDRAKLVAAQTPQCFRLRLLVEILERASLDNEFGTDEAGLAARYGFDVAVVPGDPLNFKITHPHDFAAAAAVIETWSEA